MSGIRASAIGRLMRRVRAAAQPSSAVERLKQIVGNGRSSTPTDLAVFKLYASRAASLGLHRPVLFLSFDCDTDLDPPATIEVMKLLDGLGIKATFAVPGVQLERGAEIYREVAQRGCEFMNHGHLPHAEWRDDRYVGITFYEDMPVGAVEADIRKGHETVTRLIGRPPEGFRAPHFGHFKQPHQLALLHRLAHELGYRYCSTTLPEYALIHGPAPLINQVVELPAFGSVRAPTSILDSWTHLSDRRSYALAPTYAELMIETVDRLLAAKMPALLTWYADPAHVAGQAPFERAMRHIASCGIQSLSGRETAALGRVG
ncbi:polysaccharide deacetylase family protein [Bradyrhizobium sediminis]|uniref:Chitooligosaccharide deacetylase n=1 Tax=Bradyrhizobium sediminis TaxID=2840469 RepID=A0A975RZC5_9BRAD|nr:polysaccharide deacetylase family protein [Bradyrhizobium sediminis]QWG25093.1 polysaccharide deacetylase family protein [Bradyrhizobium sediminis]